MMGNDAGRFALEQALRALTPLADAAYENPLRAVWGIQVGADRTPIEEFKEDDRRVSWARMSPRFNCGAAEPVPFAATQILRHPVQPESSDYSFLARVALARRGHEPPPMPEPIGNVLHAIYQRKGSPPLTGRFLDAVEVIGHHADEAAKAAGDHFAAELDPGSLWLGHLARLAIRHPTAFQIKVSMPHWQRPDPARDDERRAVNRLWQWEDLLPSEFGIEGDDRPMRFNASLLSWDPVAEFLHLKPVLPPGEYLFSIERNLAEASIQAIHWLLAQGDAAGVVAAASAPAESPPVDMKALANELARKGHPGPSKLVRLFGDRDSVPSYEVAAACCKKGEGASPAAIKSALYRARQAIRGLGGDWSRIDFRTAGEWVVKVVEPR